MDGGAWWATVHGVTESRTRLSDFMSNKLDKGKLNQQCWVLMFPFTLNLSHSLLTWEWLITDDSLLHHFREKLLVTSELAVEP